MKKYVLFFLIIISLNQLAAQETYQKIFTNPHISEIQGFGGAIISTNDGGYAFCGSSDWDTLGSYNVHSCIGKVDSKGNLVWVRHQEPYLDNFARWGICQMWDSSIFSVGDGTLIRVDAHGNLLWSKSFGGTARSIVANTDNTVVFTKTENYSTSPFAVCVNKYGQLLWTKLFKCEFPLSFRSVTHDKDGGFLFTGGINDTQLELEGISVTKTDKFGYVQWSKAVRSNTNGNFIGHKCISTKDGGYAVLGTVKQGQLDYTMDIYVAKLDSSFNLIWSRSFGSINNVDDAGSFIETEDSCFVIAGNYNAPQDGYLVKISNSGDFIWSKTFGGNKTEDIRDVTETNDGYVTIGTSNSFENNHRQIYFVKFDTYGNNCGEEISNPGRFKIGSDIVEDFTVVDSTVERFGGNNLNYPFFEYGGFLTKCKDVVLALDLLSFNAANKNGQNILTWNTKQQLNTKSFEIQRSENAIDFFTIGTTAASNNSSYTYTDQNPLPQINYYRIKIIDNSGNITYSEIKSVKNEKSFTLNIYPNPVKGNTATIKINSSYSSIIQVSILNIQGNILSSKKVAALVSSFSTTIDVSRLSKGIYYLKVTNGKEESIITFVRG